jgi:peptidyl-prolyl cis-trans isomerase D
MLAFFRRLTKSKVGLAIIFLLLGLLAFFMATADVSSLNQGAAAVGGRDEVVRVGDTAVPATEFAARVDQEMQGYRQQNPTLDMAQFVNGGGFVGTLERLTSGLALDRFGQDQGMRVSKRAVDGQIASIPGLQGPNGQFDAQLFRQLLSSRKLTETGVRADLQRSLMEGALTAPLLRPTVVPQQLALPYANLSLERRAGTIAFVPTKAFAGGPAPTAAEVQTYYGRNLARYTVPERRQIRFARVTLAQMQAAPTEAEIAQAFNADRAKYAATERRTITEVVVLDRAGADALAARVKAGTPLVAAAGAAGLSTTTRARLTKEALAGQTSSAVADAVFAAGRNAVVGPVRGGLGFTVARVEAIEQVAGRTLAQVRDEIAAALATQKAATALGTVRDQIDDALVDNATFDEITKDRRLTALTSPGLLASGIDPDRPGPADPTLAPLVAAAFQMGEGDEPQLVPTGEDGSFALVALSRIIPAAPRPLAQIRDLVARDVVADRSRQAARRVASQILQRVNGGASVQAAFAAAGVKAEGPKPLVASREELDRAQGPSRGPLALMFAMAPNTAKLLEAPGGGWAVIKLERIQPGDASKDQARIAAIRQAFGQLIGREYAEQFSRAAQKAVGVTTNKDAVAKVRAQLLGQSGGN